MSEDLRAAADALGVEPEKMAALMAAVSAAVSEGQARERAWLTLADLARLTGFSDDTLQAMRKRGDLPMFRAPGTREWRMTRRAFDLWERRVESEGLPVEARYPRKRLG